jgi:ABC-type sugar transport system substrate-binding protein
MKPIFASLSLLGILISISACKSSAPPERTQSTAQAGKQSITLAYDFIVQDIAMTAIWNSVKHSAQKYNAEHPDAQVNVIMTNAESKVEKQLSNVESLIVQKPDVISIVAVDEKGSVPAFEAVNRAGIRCVNALKLAATDLADVKFMALDHYWLGQLQAQWLEKYLSDNPGSRLKIGYLNSDPAVSDALSRYKGFKEHFLDKYKSSGRVELVAQNFAFWTTEKAMAITEDWMQGHPDINCIVAASDEMALGAVQVAKAANKSMLILGIDGIANGLKAIKEGSMQATTYMDTGLIGKEFFKITLALALGQKMDKTINIGGSSVVLIDKSNVDQYLK